MHSASKLLVSSPAVPCLDTTVNARMKAQVEALVRVVEGRKKCRVVSCSTEFSVDRQGRTWLLRTVSCVTAVDGPALNRRAGGEMKAARNVASSTVGQALTLATVEVGGSGEGQANGSRRKTGGHVGGSNTQERAQRRRAREGAPDEEAVQRVLAELDVSSQRPSQQHRGRESGEGESMSKTTTTAAPSSGELKEAHHEPTTTMDLRQVASSAAASKALGSTQLSGCPGDFCGKERLCIASCSRNALNRANV